MDYTLNFDFVKLAIVIDVKYLDAILILVFIKEDWSHNCFVNYRCIKTS